MEDITNCTNMIALDKGDLKNPGAFYPSNQKLGTKLTSVPHIFPLAVNNVVHLLATDRFPNELHKLGTVPTLTNNTRHWLSFAATQSVTSTTSSRLATSFTTITSLTPNIRTQVSDNCWEVGTRDELQELVEACRGILPALDVPSTVTDPKLVQFDLTLPAEVAKHNRTQALTNRFYTQYMANEESSMDDITTTPTYLNMKLQNAVAIFHNTTKPSALTVDLTTSPAPVPPPPSVQGR